MVGHKSSLEPLKASIKEAGAVSWTQTEFVQGRTMRWGLAWTYSPSITLSKSPSPSRKSGPVGKKPPSPFSYSIEKARWIMKEEEYSLAAVMSKVLEMLQELKVWA